MTNVALSLLGAPLVLIDGRPGTNAPTGKALAFLAYLAVEGRTKSREELSLLFWHDLPRDAARANLRKTLFKLNQSLGRDEVVHASGETVSIRPGTILLDVGEFLAALPASVPCAEVERIVDLYRGPFLQGLVVAGCPDFEDWLYARREICHRHALGLLERLSARLEDEGELGSALRAARRYVELEPQDEQGHRRLMRLLAANGHTHAAIGQFEQCRRVLRRELDVEPDGQTLELLQQIQAGQWHAAVARSPQRETAVAAERRQVTVLYCGATASAHDGDDLAERWLATRREIQDLIRRSGGYVARGEGGALLAYFGYPVAQEDAVLRAVRVALAAQELGDADLKIRSGLHTGMVVASAELPDSMGLTSELAIRVRNPDHGVTMTEATLRLVSGYFQVEAVGECSTQNQSRPLAVHRVIGESGARSRLDTVERLTPLVGRLQESEALLDLWQQAASGTRRVALIRGEPGLGKSRLVHALQNGVIRERHLCVELRCFPQFSQTPFHPLQQTLKALDRLADGPAKGRSATLAREALALLEPALCAPAQVQVGEPAQTSAQQWKEKTYAALLALAQALAQHQPLLVVVEDLHWADPSTLELLGRFIEEEQPGRVLVLLTARPEFTASWMDAIDATVTLAPLDSNDSARMVEAIDPQIEASVRRAIVERAGGIPLFVEEMSKVHDGLREIPSTLHDLLAAKLDSLGPAKRTAQLAATLGREFDLELLRAISDTLPDLAALRETGLVIATGAHWQFKHALIQDAAYQSQVKPDREAAHRRIAQELVKRLGAPAELLAQHWAACGEHRLAVECWIQAGKRAMLHSACDEAIAHFQAGLQRIALLPPGTQTDQLEFSLQTGLGVAFQAAQDYGSQQATQANARASALSRQITDTDELFAARWAQVLNTLAGVGPGHALAPAEELLQLANAHGDPVRRLAAHHVFADTAFWGGDFEGARAHAQSALALYRPELHEVLVQRFGEDLWVPCAAFLASASFFLGVTDEAQKLSREMIERARELDHPHTLALALCYAAVLQRWLDQPDEALALSADAIAVSREHGFPVWLAAGEMSHGWALVRKGQVAEGIALLHSSIAGMRSAVGGIAVVFLSTLVEAHMHLGQTGEALDVIARTLDGASVSGDGHYTAELHRLEGVCLLQRARTRADRERARACFERALEIATRQRAKALELRAAKCLANLARSRI